MRTPLEKIFGSRIRAKLLGWFFTHTEEVFFVRQLASILEEDATNLSREMARLEELGILRSKREGNLKRFQANPDCPFLKELKEFVLKTTGVAGQMREALATLAGIEYAFIYGSYAKGEEHANSDVDLLVVGSVDMGELDTMLNELEKRLGREINYVLYGQEEFTSKRKARDGFLTDVLEGERIMLVGKEDGLRASRKARPHR